MLAILISMLLETIVGQVDIVVPVWELIGIGGSPQIALIVHVDLLLLVYYDPDSDVKLSSLEEERPLDILLYYPTRVLRSRSNEFDDIMELIEDFDASPLIGCGRLHQPNIVSTMFHGCPFLRREAFLDLFISLKELCCVRIVHTLRNNEGCGGRIKNIIACITSLVILTVVMLQGFDKPSFCGEAFQYLKVVVEESRPRTFNKSLIYPLIPLRVIVYWSPYEMALLNTMCFIFQLNDLIMQ